MQPLKQTDFIETQCVGCRASVPPQWLFYSVDLTLLDPDRSCRLPMNHDLLYPVEHVICCKCLTEVLDTKVTTIEEFYGVKDINIRQLKDILNYYKQPELMELNWTR